MTCIKGIRKENYYPYYPKKKQKVSLISQINLASTYNLCLIIQSVCTFQRSNMDFLYYLFIHFPALGLPQSYLSFT